MKNKLHLLTLAVSITLAGAARAQVQQIGDIFYIAMENHNWTQPGGPNNGTTQQIFGSIAAPYINSLVTPGDPNAVHTAYETSYYQPGAGEHPSEPNYVWAEAGTNFNPTSTIGTATATNQGTITGTKILSDADPALSSGNIYNSTFAANHLTGQLNAAGVTWKNYEEDYQISNSTTPTGGSPLVSKSGTSTTVTNPYYGTNQYNYAAKHNPMAFFADTATQNINTLGQLSLDLTNNTVGRYNWITPNQFNDMHSALTGGFTDPRTGTHFTGDQAMIAQGDYFLSVVIPQIMASQAYQNNGAIVIWNDETENGDTTSQTSMEIVISNLAKGNAYASSVVTNHSSDIKTVEELLGLSQINNPIPSTETFATGGYATVQGSNDLSDLFVAGAVPEPSTVVTLFGGLGMLAMRRRTRVA